MIRPSSLTIAKYCQLAPVLSERYPSVSAATERGSDVDAQVTAWAQDGIAPTDLDAMACVEWLTEQFDPTEWNLNGQVRCQLFYEGKLVCKAGTADLVAFRDSNCVVVDYKKREQYDCGRLADPDDNDQLHAYALAWGLPYRTVLLLFGNGRAEAIWSKEYTPENWGPILQRIIDVNRPIEGEPKGTSGAHCLKCYPREHCPNWALIAHKGLERTEYSTAVIPDLYLEKKAMQERAERHDKMLKHLIDKFGNTPINDTQEIGRVMMPGKVSIDTQALEEAGLYERFARVGRSFPRYMPLKRSAE